MYKREARFMTAYSVFTLPDTETVTDKIVRNVHPAQRQTPTRIAIGFCIRFISLGLRFCIGHYQCEHTIRYGRHGACLIATCIGLVNNYLGHTCSTVFS